MKNLFFFVLFLLIISSCSKEQLQDSPDSFNSKVTGKIPFNPSWDEETKLFFDLNNASVILDQQATSHNRGGDAPLVLSKAMKKLAKDDEQYDFIKSIKKIIGHPVWKYSIVEPTVDGSKHIIYVPFVKNNLKETKAFLIGYLDLENPDEILLDLRTTQTFDKILMGERPITKEIAQDITRIKNFDRYIFEKENIKYDDLFCEACNPDNIEELNNVSTRSCLENNIVVCSFQNETQQYYGGGAGNYDITSNPWGSYSEGGLVVYGVPENDIDVDSEEWGEFWDAVTDFFTDAINTIEETLRDLWRRIFDPIPCPDFNETPEAVTRSGEYVCAEHWVIICQTGGGYWEIVESDIVEGSDENLTQEEYFELVCDDNIQTYFDDNNVPRSTRFAIEDDLIDCCNEYEFDEECALNKTIEEYFTPILPPSGDYIDLESAIEDCFGPKSPRGDFIDCNTKNSTFSVTLYVDQPVSGTRKTFTSLGNNTDVGHTFISATHTVNGNDKTLVFGFYPLNGVYPPTPTSSPAIYDNGGHSYDVSATYSLSCTEFNDFLQESLWEATKQYHLQNNNCTDFGLSIFNNSAGASLPDTEGTWGVFYSGSNPGDLGEDMRTITDPSATINTTGGSAPRTNCH